MEMKKGRCASEFFRKDFLRGLPTPELKAITRRPQKIHGELEPRNPHIDGGWEIARPVQGSKAPMDSVDEGTSIDVSFVPNILAVVAAKVLTNFGTRHCRRSPLDVR